MEPENTLRNMALYDFKTPINVIFYDEPSDDENKSENAVALTQNNAVDTDKQICMKSIIMEEKNVKNIKDDESIMPSMPKICENKEVNEHFEKCTRNETENSKKNKKCYKLERGKRKSNDLFHNDEVIKQKNNNYVPNTSETSHDKNISLGSPSNLLQDSDDIMKDPLKSISNCLIILAESYSYHISISNKKPTKNNKEISKKHYLEIKYHFFKTAYEIVNANIIPKEKDQAFIDGFLNSTIKIADKKTKCDSSNIIKTLFTELIKWVKERKRQDTKVKLIKWVKERKPQDTKVKKPKGGEEIAGNNNKNPNSILIEKLSQPPILNFTYPVNEQDHTINGNTVINTTKNQNKSTPTCTLTPELPGEEISIDFNTALSNNENNKTIINNDTSRDKNIQSQNPLPASQLFQYMQNCSNNRNRNYGLTGTGTHIDVIPFVSHNNLQPITATEMAHNNIPTNQINNTVYNNGISRDKNVGSQNPLAASQLLYYLQNSNNNRPLNNNAEVTIPLVNHNMVQPNTNQMVHNDTINNISYQQTPSTDANAIYSKYFHKNNACSSSIAPRHCLNASSSNNTAFNLMDPRQPTSNSSYQQAPSSHPIVVHSPYYHKDIPVSSSTLPRCYRKTVERRAGTNQRQINDSNSNPNMHLLQYNTTNVLTNETLNRHYHNRPANAICENSIAANDIRGAPPPYNATHYLPGQNINYRLNNFTNSNMANTPMCLPSNSRPISSSTVDRSHLNVMENRTHNYVQNQEVTARQPPRYPEKEQAPLAHDYGHPVIVQQNVPPEPHRSRSSFSTDSGFASPVASGDGGNSMEEIMNSLFELEETTEQTNSLPVITHVTSLSTKVAFVKEGSCYMCGKNAKQMCSGCYEIYYCSTDCQASNWSSHRYKCGEKSVKLN